jgi:DNA polymerase-3 subunit delta
VKIQAHQLASRLRQGLAPCYLVTGDEHLLVAEALDAIRAAARDAGYTLRERHSASRGFDWQQLREAGASLSLFAEKRIVELTLPTGKPGTAGSAAIVEFVDRLHPDLLFLVSGPKLGASANAKWAKKLDQVGVSVPVWPIEPGKLPRWVAERMKAAGLTPDRDAVLMLADRVEGNLLAAAQEIEKLRLLHGAGAISADDILGGVADSSRFDVFKLGDAALAGDAAKALRILDGVAAEGVTPVLAVWSLARDVRILARVGEAVSRRQDAGAVLKQFGVWRNRQDLFRNALSRHPVQSAYRMLKMLGEADGRAKGQAPGDPWQLLTAIVVCLAGNSRRRAA